MARTKSSVATLDVNGAPTNGAADMIEIEIPYTVRVTIEGTSQILWHRWNNEAVAEKAASKKGSTQKKSDDLESYVFRDAEGNICLPGNYLWGSILTAAKFRQDPRSPRKSAMDLYKASVIPLTDLAPLQDEKGRPYKSWDFVDQRRVTIQRAGITRSRPACNPGWRATIDFLVQAPEYISPQDLREVLHHAGRMVGLADFRPTYGRFSIVGWEVFKLDEE